MIKNDPDWHDIFKELPEDGEHVIVATTPDGVRHSAVWHRKDASFTIPFESGAIWGFDGGMTVHPLESGKLRYWRREESKSSNGDNTQKEEDYVMDWKPEDKKFIKNAIIAVLIGALGFAIFGKIGLIAALLWMVIRWKI